VCGSSKPIAPGLLAKHLRAPHVERGFRTEKDPTQRETGRQTGPGHLRIPDTLPNCRTGIAIRIRYRYFPIRLRYGIEKYQRKRKITLISILTSKCTSIPLNSPPIPYMEVSVLREGQEPQASSSIPVGVQIDTARFSCQGGLPV
jgi:hypothetical protein